MHEWMDVAVGVGFIEWLGRNSVDDKQDRKWNNVYGVIEKEAVEEAE